MKPRLSKPQRKGLLYAQQRWGNRVEPWIFTHRTIGALLSKGVIEYLHGYGAPMYQLTPLGRGLLITNSTRP